MTSQFNLEPMLDLYIFETAQLVEQLEQLILTNEKSGGCCDNQVNEIFRIMHTVKGSSAMMLFDNIAAVAHSLEDIFYYLREHKPQNVDYAGLADLVLAGIDFIKNEVDKIKSGCEADGNANELIGMTQQYLATLQTANNASVSPAGFTQLQERKEQYYISQCKVGGIEKNNYFKATIFFQDGCEMENIRAYTIVHSLKDLVSCVSYIPEDIIDNDNTAEFIKNNGFQIFIATTMSYSELLELLNKTIFLKELSLEIVDEELHDHLNQPVILDNLIQETPGVQQLSKDSSKPAQQSLQQSMISVGVNKLDMLMDLVGELVTAQAMVTENPDIKGLELENFQKAARQLEKITGSLQDIVMSIRMVPIALTFQKMHRIVRDMSKKLNKEITLELTGEDTEVDKNVIESISDPLMHLIRNAIDHGIEPPDERILLGKPMAGKIVLEARHAGSDVIILIKDDGRGLDRDKILRRARENGLIQRSDRELTDKEVYSLIFLPGFSTKENVTEFSGRGVGMDVVTKNITSVGGSVVVDSIPGNGSTITLKIPLTLAIVEGMIIRVGLARYIIPITAIHESFKPLSQNIIVDPDGNEMIMVRGHCYPILRVHRSFGIATKVTDFEDGIMIMVENEDRTICIFVDELIGKQQVVVKNLPEYLKSIRPIKGVAGCTLLGDGGISLIMDIPALMNSH